MTIGITRFAVVGEYTYTNRPDIPVKREYINSRGLNGSYVTTTFATKAEAADYLATLPEEIGGDYPQKWAYEIEDICYEYANFIGWSDVAPYEVVRVISDKTIEIREMEATELPWKKEIQIGGFSHHCSNQHDQKWSIKSDTNNPVIRARLRKDGDWHSKAGRHVLSDEPRKFYDYNF